MTTSPPLERLWIAAAGRRRLAPRRAVAFDWLGYGRSDRSDTAGFTVEEHGSELAAALLNTMFGNRPSLQLPEMIRLLADPAFNPLADAMINDEGQRLWLLQHTADQWGLDALDGLATQSILPQFFGDTDQPDALAAIRVWTAGLFDGLDQQGALIDSGVLGHLEVPVSIIFGEKDRYLNPSLAAEIAGLFPDPSFHLVEEASHWPQYDQPEVVAGLLKAARTAR